MNQLNQLIIKAVAGDRGERLDHRVEFDLEGRSTVTLATYRKATAQIAPDAEIRRYLPPASADRGNTYTAISAGRLLRSALKDNGIRRGLEARVETNTERASAWLISLAGECADGRRTIEEQQYRLTVHWTGGAIDSVMVDCTAGQYDPAVQSALIDGAEASEGCITSRAWLAGWSMLHYQLRTVPQLNRRYSASFAHQREIIGAWLDIASACGLRTGRSDQPWVAQEGGIVALVREQLERATARLHSDSRTRASTVEASLRDAEELSALISSLEEEMGEVHAHLRASHGELLSSLDRLERAVAEGAVMVDAPAPAPEPAPAPAPAPAHWTLTESGMSALHALTGAEEAGSLQGQGEAILVALRNLDDADEAVLGLLAGEGWIR